MATKRVLFVDDEPNILQGLRRMLRGMRKEWEMAFANSGQEALALMAEQDFDVVVTDMMMPGMDGAQLLNEIKQRYPNVIRIILSGHADRELIMSSLGATHQYLSKPCSADVLKAAVERAFNLNSLFEEDPTLKPLISRVQSLPSVPALYIQVMEELRNPDTTINRIGEIVAQDPAMTAKILQLINSAFFGLSKPVSDPARAVRLLGMDTVRMLVLSAHVFKQFDKDAIRDFNLDALWYHGTIVGHFARQIARSEGADDDTCNDAMMAGILHDIGKLILLVNLPGEYRQLLQMAAREEADLFELERMYFGASHAEIGAYLLGLWGLPNPIVEAVANHHHIGDPGVTEFSAMVAVYVANVLSHELIDQAGPAEEMIDMDYLGPYSDRLAVWRDVCQSSLKNGLSNDPPVASRFGSVAVG